MPDFFLHKVPPNIYDKDNCHVMQTKKKKNQGKLPKMTLLPKLYNKEAKGPFCVIYVRKS